MIRSPFSSFCQQYLSKLFLLFFLFPLISSGQNHAADSLKLLLKKADHDTSRALLQNEIGLSWYYHSAPDSAIAWWKNNIAFTEEKSKLYKGEALSRILRAEGDALNNTGIVYTDRGMTAPALECNFKSLRLRESIKDHHGIAESLNNIAFIYGQQHDTAKAIEYYSRSEIEYALINDSGGVAYTQINRGLIYYNLNNDSLAMKMFLKALPTVSAISDYFRGYCSCLNSLGNISMRSGRYDVAMNYMLTSLAIREKHQDIAGIAGSYVNIGKLYATRGNADSALYYAEKAYTIGRQIKNIQTVNSSAKLLSELYDEKKEYEKAFGFYKVFIATRDSVSSEENRRQTLRQQMSYEYAKKSTADSLTFAQEKALGEIRLSRQRGFTIGGFSALVIVALLLFFVYRQRNGIAREKKRSDELLLNILPAETADELKQTGSAKTKKYESVTVMFTDFKNFTQTAETLSPEALVELINFCYGEFDRIVSRYNVEKIKTIGDSYMCAGGLPVANKTNAADTLKAAFEMLAFIKKHNEERKKQQLPFFDIRIGLHSGPVVAGIVGTKKFAYDIWGDTVNIASRMESSGEPGRINISETTYRQVKELFDCEYRGKIKAKNKGEIDMYFVNGPLMR